MKRMEAKLEREERETDTDGGEMNSGTESMGTIIIKRRVVATTESMGRRSEAKNLGESPDTKVLSLNRRDKLLGIDKMLTTHIMVERGLNGNVGKNILLHTMSMKTKT